MVSTVITNLKNDHTIKKYVAWYLYLSKKGVQNKKKDYHIKILWSFDNNEHDVSVSMPSLHKKN